MIQSRIHANRQRASQAAADADTRNIPPRPELLDRIIRTGKIRSKITCIVAPMGYGKTALMAYLRDMLTRSRRQHVWHTLEDHDASVEGVLASFQAQLTGDEEARRSSSTLINRADTPSRRIDELVNLLNSIPFPIVILLDNLNACDDPLLSTLINRLCFDTRTGVQLIISSTHDIPLNKSRALLSGMVTEADRSDLAFDGNQTRELLGERLVSQLGEDGVGHIVAITEGWPAATRLVRIILEKAPAPKAALVELGGANTDLSVLLSSRVLSVFNADMKRFLVSASLLPRFNAELCRAACQESKSAELIEELVRRNTLIIALDANRDWYRFHFLFREYLLGEAVRTMPGEARRRLHRRAADWCMRNSHWRQAIDHLLKAADDDAASQLLEQHADEAVRDRGDIARFLGWVETLIQRGRSLGPSTEYWFIWALAFRRRYDEALRRLHGISPRAAGPDTASDLLHARRIEALRMSIRSLADQVQAAQQNARNWLKLKSETDDPFDVAAAHCIIAHADISNFRFSDARMQIRSAHACAFQTGSPYVVGWVSTYEALATIAEGNYAQAYDGLVTALSKARADLGEASGVGGMLAMLSAYCAAEMGLDDEAHELAVHGLQTARESGFLDAAYCGLHGTISVSGDPFDPEAIMTHEDDILRAYPPRLALMAGCSRIRRLLALGRMDAACREAGAIGLYRYQDEPETAPPLTPFTRELVALTVAGMAVRMDHSADVAASIRLAAGRARREHRMAAFVEWTLLHSILMVRQKADDVARNLFTESIRIAAPRRIVRPFLNHATEMGYLVRNTKPAQWLLGQAEEREMLSEFQVRFSDGKNDVPELEDDNPVCELSARETELLELVAAGLTNQQIATRTGLTISTVKWHFQNVFGKLNATNRTMAIAIARAHGIIPLQPGQA